MTSVQCLELTSKRELSPTSCSLDFHTCALARTPGMHMYPPTHPEPHIHTRSNTTKTGKLKTNTLNEQIHKASQQNTSESNLTTHKIANEQMKKVQHINKYIISNNEC